MSSKEFGAPPPSPPVEGEGGGRTGGGREGHAALGAGHQRALSTFADSSALAKLYADEEQHEEVRRLEAVAIAQLARLEVPAALWRKQRLGELAADQARLL